MPGGATAPGIVEITFKEVERSLQQKEDVIIDVRTFKEAAEGQIPSANVLPGQTAVLCHYLRRILRYYLPEIDLLYISLFRYVDIHSILLGNLYCQSLTLSVSLCVSTERNKCYNILVPS